jgi:hypothetical protein
MNTIYPMVENGNLFPNAVVGGTILGTLVNGVESYMVRPYGLG